MKKQTKEKQAEYIVTIYGKRTERNLKQLEGINKWFNFHLHIESDDYKYEEGSTEYMLGKWTIESFYWGKTAKKYFYNDVVWHLADLRADVKVKKDKNNIIVTFN